MARKPKEGKSKDGWRKIPGNAPVEEVVRAAQTARKGKPQNTKREKPKPQNAKPESTKARKRRPHVKYSQEIADEICRLRASGLTLRKICERPGMPDESTVRAWALDEDHPFFPQYARANDLFWHKQFDDLFDIVDDGRNDWVERQNSDGETYTVVDHEHIQRSKLRFEARRWMLAKALPKVCGDKLALTNPEGGPLVVEIVRFSDNGGEQ